MNLSFINLVMYKYIRNHILTILNTFEKELDQTNNLIGFDTFLRRYFKTHKSIGSDQRSQISEKAYALMRYNIFLDHLCYNKSWQKKLEMIFTPEFHQRRQQANLPLHIRCSQNQLLFQMMKKKFGADRALQISEIMNHRAPLTIRINPDKISRDQFLRNWRQHSVIKTDFSPFGVKFIEKKKFNLLQTQQFKNGEFQIQDEASQLAALEIKCKPGDLILDYCSGSGGKALAIAHLLKNKGQIFLHDPRQKSLIKARKRMERAGVQNVQFHHNELKLEMSIKEKIDWLILDMPCTGTGTLRRNPDIKMKFNRQWLNYHINIQQSIFHKSLKYLGRRGRIVYMTCSILAEQNEHQIQHFMKKYGLKLVNDRYLSLVPQQKGMDGFFAATLQY